MPETTHALTNLFSFRSSSFSGLAQTNAAFDFTHSIDSLDDMELFGMGLPELKLTRQNGKYYDVDDGCDEYSVVA